MKQTILFSFVLFSCWSLLFAEDPARPPLSNPSKTLLAPDHITTYLGPEAGYDPTDSYYDTWVTTSCPLGVDQDGYSYAISWSPVTAQHYGLFLYYNSIRPSSDGRKLFLPGMSSGQGSGIGGLFLVQLKIPVAKLIPSGSNYSIDGNMHLPMTFIELFSAVRYVNWYNWFVQYKEDYKKEHPSYKEDDVAEELKFESEVRAFCSKNKTTENGTYLMYGEGELDSQSMHFMPDVDGIKAAILKDQAERKTNPAKPPLKMVFLIPKSILSDFFTKSSEETDPYSDNSIQNACVPVMKDAVKEDDKKNKKKGNLPTYSSYLYEWTSSYTGVKQFIEFNHGEFNGKYYKVGFPVGTNANKALSEGSETPCFAKLETQERLLTNMGFRLMEVTFPPDANPDKLPKPVEDANRDIDEYRIAPPPPPETKSMPDQPTAPSAPVDQLTSDQSTQSVSLTEPNKTNEQINIPTT